MKSRNKGSTNGDIEDGRLSAREILDLTLQADLAVLSARETARGQLAEGEGMIGLTWALFIPGVPTTVVSQWRVDSDGTAELMVGFHRHLMGARAPACAAAALRASALALLSTERFRHPFYWAGFVTIGDGLRARFDAGAVSASWRRRIG
jgi:CHAT domain-containing protein